VSTTRVVTFVLWFAALFGLGAGVSTWARARVIPPPRTPAVAASAAPSPAALPHARRHAKTRSSQRPFPLEPRLVTPVPATTAPADAAPAAGRAASPAPGPDTREIRDVATVLEPVAPVLAMAQPHTMQVVPVPVPPALVADQDLRYVIMPEPGTHILPPFEGAVSGRPVVVTVEVAALAPVGTRPLAWVEFRKGGVTRQRVPVRLAVSQAHGATLRLAQAVQGARAGDRVSFRYFLTNTGNGRDTITVRAALPSGWRVDGLPARQVLDPGATITADAVVIIPHTSGDGALRLRFFAAVAGMDVAEADATVNVVREGMAVPGRGGPVLTVGIASVMTDQATAAPVVGLGLQGALSNDLVVSGRLIRPLDPATADALALARVGYYLGGSYVSVASSRWTATAGSYGRSFSDVTGMNIYSRGGAFTYDDGRWTADAIAGAPAQGDVTGNGHLYGARVGAKVSGGWVGATATDLADDEFQMRQLQAYGVGGITPPFAGGMTISGELAERQFQTGSGLGWSAEANQRNGNDFLQLRAMQAPGGTAAFARASQELLANASHGFGQRVVLSGGAWLSDDENPAYSKLQSTGWSLAPQYLLNSHMTLFAEARASGYTAKSTVGDFGNSDRTLRFGATIRDGSAYGIGSVFVGEASRNTALPAAPSVTTTANREGGTVTGGWVTPRGTLESNLTYERNGPGIGYLPEQISALLRASGVSVMRDGGGPLLHAEVQYYNWFGSIQPVTVFRAGFDQPLPGQLMLTVDVEHNPLLNGRDAGWVPVVKIEHAVHLPNLARSRVRGIVYEDRNGNGVQDRGEPGIRGVMVRRDGELAVTDQNGEFEFTGRSGAPVSVDETSLPFGMVANPSTAGQTGDGPFVIGVWPTASVTVRLVPTADSTGRVPHANLTKAGVRAIDRFGNAWSAVVDSTGTARFEALPPGTYKIDLDVSGVREPVRVRGALPSFEVFPGRTIPPLTIPLLPRPIRVFDPSKQSGRGATRPQGHP